MVRFCVVAVFVLVAFVVNAGAGVAAAGTVAETTAVVCAVNLDNPHYTPRAGGIISKARVTCRGEADVPTVQVQIAGRIGGLTGDLASGPGLGPARPWSSVDITQSVTINVGPTTFYIPPPGTRLARFSGWYEVSAQGRIVAPPGVRMDNWLRPVVKTVYVNVP